METTQDQFWDKVATRYSQQPISDQQTYARKLEATQSYMRPDMRILEIGCGTGSTAIQHAPHVSEIDATDISSAMINIGKERAAKAGVTNIEFSTQSIETLSAGAYQYDMVLALNVVHLLKDHRAAIEKIHNLTKPGGLFISSTVCLGDRMRLLRPVIAVMQWIGKAPYVSFLKSEQVTSEIMDAGFAIEERWNHGRMNTLFMVARKQDAK